MKKYSAGMMAAHVGAMSIAGLVACSSASAPAADTTPDASDTETGPSCDPCGDDGGGGTSASAGHDSNPQGIPYPAPAGGYGHQARSGSTPGSVIANFKFLGYLGGDSSKPLTTISLADYYDPCAKTYKLIHLSVAAVWCVPCNDETDAFVAGQGTLDSDKIVVLQALDDGPVEGTPATLGDLNGWITKHNSNFTEMLDPGLKNLGGFFNAAAIPWNSDIDPRTMEMIDSSEGWAGSVQEEVAPGMSGLPATPSYPLPDGVSCN